MSSSERIPSRDAVIRVAELIGQAHYRGHEADADPEEFAADLISDVLHWVLDRRRVGLEDAPDADAPSRVLDRAVRYFDEESQK